MPLEITDQIGEIIKLIEDEHEGQKETNFEVTEDDDEKEKLAFIGLHIQLCPGMNVHCPWPDWPPTYILTTLNFF